MFSTDRSFRLAAVLAVGLGLASAAFAGPPLICHPFTTGTGAPLLPPGPSTVCACAGCGWTCWCAGCTCA